MRPLSAPLILQLWEIGQQQHPVDRALTLLSFACPDRPLEELASLSIGQRDRLLIGLRELTFGPTMQGVAVCPHCGERLEFALETTMLRESSPTVCEAETSFTLADFEIQATLPTSRDLAAIAPCPDQESARALLVQRCLRQVSQSGMPLEAAALPPDLVIHIADQLAAADPQAEIWLDLTCPACQHLWQALFDIVEFFWVELAAQAKRLMQEVHTLARFYGWREVDILGMSGVRRQGYLGMVRE